CATFAVSWFEHLSRFALSPYSTLFRSRGVFQDRNAGDVDRVDFAQLPTGNSIYDHQRPGVVPQGGSTPDQYFGCILPRFARFLRSEEHTSELQSREKLVCRLLLEKKIQ